MEVAVKNSINTMGFEYVMQEIRLVVGERAIPERLVIKDHGMAGIGMAA